MLIRILLVDDNLDTLRHYERDILRKVNQWRPSYEFSVETDTADSVPLALEKLRSHTFEILVVDLKLQGLSGEEMGGLEIISESTNLDPLRRIIVMTGFPTVGLVRETFTRGVFDFIEKDDGVDQLINAIHRAIDDLNDKRTRLGNPFTHMSGVDPTVFGGRTKELEFFDQKLHRTLHTRFREHFLLLGDWGIGKSTLLKEFKKVCNSRGYIACVVQLEPLQAGAKSLGAARSMVEGILRDLPYPIGQFRNIAKYIDSIGINVLGTGFHFSRETFDDEFSTQAFLHDSLTNLWQDLKDRSEVFVILLDDLDNLAPVPEVALAFMQALSMGGIRDSRILVGMASTHISWQKLTSAERLHPLARFFTSRLELTELSHDELYGTIMRSLSNTGVSFNRDVIERVDEYSRGHPYEMQLLCYHLFENQLSGRVQVDVWDKALQDTLTDLGTALFDFRCQQASPEEKKVLSFVATSRTPVLTKELQEACTEGELNVASKSLSKYLQRLVDKALLARNGRGSYLIPDAMFSEYIRTHLAPIHLVT